MVSSLSLTIIGAHGLTDMVIGFFDINMWLIYMSYAIIVFKSSNFFNKILFITHSISHFSKDIGLKNSILVSTIIPLILIRYCNLNCAIYFQIAYLLILHVPLHYYRKYNLLIKSPMLSYSILTIGHILMYKLFKFKNLRNLSNPEKKAMISIICSHVFYNDYYLK